MRVAAFPPRFLALGWILLRVRKIYCGIFFSSSYELMRLALVDVLNHLIRVICYAILIVKGAWVLLWDLIFDKKVFPSSRWLNSLFSSRFALFERPATSLCLLALAVYTPSIFKLLVNSLQIKRQILSRSGIQRLYASLSPSLWLWLLLTAQMVWSILRGVDPRSCLICTRLEYHMRIILVRTLRLSRFKVRMMSGATVLGHNIGLIIVRV